MHHNIFSNNNFTPLKINTLGFAKDISVTKFGPGQRDLYIIHYVTKGKGYFNGNPVTKNQGFLIRPGQFEEYHADKTDPWEFLWVISSDNKMEEVFKRYNADFNTSIFDYSSSATMEKTINEIISQNNGILDSMKMLELFLHIFNSHQNKKVLLSDKPNSLIYIDFCTEYIESNIHKKVTVSELSELLGVSQPYLYKLFINKFKISPKQYISQYKLNHAKKLLAETNMSVTEIANSVGYNDILSFSKYFSQKEKISPQKYRFLTRNP